MYCELPEVYGTEKPKARKEHKCCECEGIISIGENYHRHHGVFDGSGFTYKTCNDCEQLKALLDAETPYAEDHTAFTYLYETVFERGELEHMATFLEIKEKRSAPIAQWMKDRIDEALNRSDEKEEEQHDNQCEFSEPNEQ